MTEHTPDPTAVWILDYPGVDFSGFDPAPEPLLDPPNVEQ